MAECRGRPARLAFKGSLRPLAERADHNPILGTRAISTAIPRSTVPLSPGEHAVTGS